MIYITDIVRANSVWQVLGTYVMQRQCTVSSRLKTVSAWLRLVSGSKLSLRSRYRSTSSIHLSLNRNGCVTLWRSAAAT